MIKSALLAGSSAGFDMDATDRNLMPLLGDEILRGEVTSRGLNWQPFCSNKYCLECCNVLRLFSGQEPITHLCSHEGLGICWPYLPYLCSCALRPFVKKQRMIITDTAIIGYSASRNWGLCGFRECGLDKEGE